MRIVNNKIYIAKGETPTYSARIIDKDTGAPLIIDKGIYDGNKVNTILIEFVVRDSAYSTGDDKRLRYHLILGNEISYHVFDDTKIVPYNGHPSFEDNGRRIVWDALYTPEAGNENRVHHYVDNDDNFYCYYHDGEWKDYNFEFNVTFRYSETSIMEPKTYKYEIALLGGNPKKNTMPGELPITIEYKKQLLGLTDFVVEGSISE